MRVNVQIGQHPLRKHKITQYLQSQLSYTIGEDGQIVAWVDNLPQFMIEPCISGECMGKVVCSLALLRQIRTGQPSLHLITVHSDNRLRMFNAHDGLCTNITSHNVFDTTVSGIVENTVMECRFILCFDEEKVYVFDSWTMKVVGEIMVVGNHYSHWVRGRMNNKREVEMMDGQGNVYKRDISKLFCEVLLDVGSLIFSPEQAHEPLQTILLELQHPLPPVISYKKLPPHSSSIPQIDQYLHHMQKKSVWEDVFIDDPILQYIKSLQQSPTTSTLYFVNGKELWYWIGCSKGTVFGRPTILTTHELLLHIDVVDFGCVQYIQVIDDILMISWSNGIFRAYNLDNLPSKHSSGLNINHNKIHQQKLSSTIKQRLDLYHTQKGKVTTERFAFQLTNKEVMVFYRTQPICYSFRGLPEDIVVYAVLEMPHYYGIAHQEGIDLFGVDAFQRSVGYDDWEWGDLHSPLSGQGCQQFYHHIEEKQFINGVQMIQHSERYLNCKIDFYRATPQLQYETYGVVVQDKNLSVPFMKQSQAQKTIHSTCVQNATSILKITRNNTWLLSLNVNTQLCMMQQQPSQLQTLINQQYTMFSAFLWDVNYIPFLSTLYTGTQNKFLLQRRYTEQGIGKSFVVYFNNKANHRHKMGVSNHAITSTALLYALNIKDQYGDKIREVTEYFTSNKQLPSIDAVAACRIAVSGNEPILNACIKLLMGVGKSMALYPAYEHFILNYKQMQMHDHLELNEVEGEWLVYLYISIFYGGSEVDEEQLRAITNRLVEAIEVGNCEQHGHIMMVVMRILNRSITKWKQYISTHMATDLYIRLFRLFFLCDGVNIVKNEDKKFDFRLITLSQSQLLKMMQHLLITIISLSKYFIDEFFQVVRTEVLNQKHHPIYPNTVLEIFRQYLKTQHQNHHISLSVQLLFQCIAPMNQSLRKHTHAHILAAIQQLSNHPAVSFSPTSQKVLVRTDDNLHIYCLKTAKKAKTIPIKEFSHDILKISPKGNYIALLGQKLRIWKINSGFWSGVMGTVANSSWVFDSSGNDIRWEENQESLTVINQNPSFNRYFKL